MRDHPTQETLPDWKHWKFYTDHEIRANILCYTVGKAGSWLLLHQRIPILLSVILILVSFLFSLQRPPPR
jgi:hypothetical protein